MLSAMLAKTLPLSTDGKEGASKTIFDQAITTPIGKQERLTAQVFGARGKHGVESANMRSMA